MLANEALEILGLKPGATPAAIKESYRDLVKVWHPDRFADDPRLRQKAEDKLKQLNHAYQALRSGTATAAATPPTPPTPPPASDRPAPPPPPRTSPRRRTAPPARPAMRPGLWFYTLLAMFFLALAVYAVRENQPDQIGIHPTDPASPAERSNRAALDNPRPGRTASPTASQGQNGPPPFQVRGLSDADSAQLESACGSLQELPDTSAYQSCIKAQLAAITNAPGAPDLSGLSTPERESIESACAHLGDPAAHDRCLTIQMAELAASPARPDLTGLTDADRASIESACTAAKSRGPTAYNRCRIRLIKLLADSK